MEEIRRHFKSLNCSPPLCKILRVADIKNFCFSSGLNGFVISFNLTGFGIFFLVVVTGCGNNKDFLVSCTTGADEIRVGIWVGSSVVVY